MDKRREKKLKEMLVNVGDLGFRRRVLEIVRGLEIKDGELVLDCGCGEGFYVMVISQLFPNVKIVGFDHDKSLLEKAKKWVGNNKNVTWVLGDIYKIPYPDNYFDKIILSEVLEHIPDDKRALKEVKRVLKPRGKIAITVPNHNYPLFWDPLNWVREHLGLGHFSCKSGFLGGIWAMHLRLYYPWEIENLVKEVGLKIEEIRGLTHYCFPFNHNILYLGKQFYTHFPVSKSVYNSMEKFAWKESTNSLGFFASIIKKVFEIFKLIDKLNERKISVSKSSMCILIFGKK